MNATGSREESDALGRRLAEAIAYCSIPRKPEPLLHQCPSKSPVNCKYLELRTPALRRSVLPYCREDGEVNALVAKPGKAKEDMFDLTTLDEKRAIFEELVERRADLLRARHALPSTPPQGLPGGRLVAFLPEQTIWDGGSTLESRCYFDWFDTPPWDAWVWLGERVPDKTWGSDCYLLAWVPSSRIEDVDGGIEFCPSDCLHWATKIELPVSSMLRDLGLA